MDQSAGYRKTPRAYVHSKKLHCTQRSVCQRTATPLKEVKFDRSPWKSSLESGGKLRAFLRSLPERRDRATLWMEGLSSPGKCVAVRASEIQEAYRFLRLLRPLCVIGRPRNAVCVRVYVSV